MDERDNIPMVNRHKKKVNHKTMSPHHKKSQENLCASTKLYNNVTNIYNFNII
jgi:hypothetical protein